MEHPPLPRILVQREGPVALLELNRPDAKNALAADDRRLLLTQAESVAEDPAVRAVVLTGAGSAFCAGADLKSAGTGSATGPRRAAGSLLHVVKPLVECLGRMDKPVIAAVNGAAVGFGMSLALACDMLVMDEEAYLLSQFVRFGLVPDGGAAWFLAQRVGYPRMFEILLDAGRLDAERCLQWGIANRVASAGEARAEALAWAHRLAATAPTAVALTKRLARLATANRLEESLVLEAEFQAMCANSPDSREAIAAFAEKRAPRFDA
jgi:enoyl-CoA hydratase/carnithine racemase